MMDDWRKPKMVNVTIDVLSEPITISVPRGWTSVELRYERDVFTSTRQRTVEGNIYLALGALFMLRGDAISPSQIIITTFVSS